MGRTPAARQVLAIAAATVAALLAACAARTQCPAQGTLPTDSKALPAPAPRAGAAIPSFGHIFIIMMENEPYQALIGSPRAPFINRLAQTYAFAAQYYGVSHPSLPNNRP